MNGNDDLAKTLNEGLQFEETPTGSAPAAPSTDTPTSTSLADDDLKMPSLSTDTDVSDDKPEAPSMGSTPPPTDDTKNDTTDTDDEDDSSYDEPAKTSDNSELDDLKASALDELRPLVGKLNLPAEERFDTLLLIIRSTDDQALLKQAHDAAKEISDDTRRAQALLDVIKEIDYFSSKR